MFSHHSGIVVFLTVFCLSCSCIDLSHSTFWSATQSRLLGCQATVPPCVEECYRFDVAPINWQLIKKPGLYGTHNCLTFLPHVKTASLFKIKPACILCRTSINNAAGLTCASCLRSPLSRLAFKRTAAMSRRYRGSRSHRRHSCCCASNRRTR